MNNNQNQNQIQVKQNYSVSQSNLTQSQQLLVGIAENYCQLFNNYDANNAKRLALQFANKLEEVKTKTNQPALAICTKESIQQAFFEVLDKNIDLSKSQGALICYGNKIKLQLEYFGNVKTAKETIPNLIDIRGTVIYKGDEIEVSVNNGLYKIEKHKTNFANMKDANIVGAYSIAIYRNEKGEEYQGEVEIMNMEELKKAWLQSSNGTSVHTKFGHEMARKTVESRNAKHLLNKSTSSKYYFNIDDEENEQTNIDKQNAIDVSSVLENETPTQSQMPTQNFEEKPTTEFNQEKSIEENSTIISEPIEPNNFFQESNFEPTNDYGLNSLGDMFNNNFNNNQFQEPSFSEPQEPNYQIGEKKSVLYSEWLNNYKPTGNWKLEKYDKDTKTAQIIKIQ